MTELKVGDRVRVIHAELDGFEPVGEVVGVRLDSGLVAVHFCCEMPLKPAAIAPLTADEVCRVDEGLKAPLKRCEGHPTLTHGDLVKAALPHDCDLAGIIIRFTQAGRPVIQLGCIVGTPDVLLRVLAHKPRPVLDDFTEVPA